MQVYLEDDMENFKTRFLQLLAGYLEVEERNLGKIIYANAKTKEAFSFPGLPFYIPNPLCETEKSLHSNELEIAKAISKEALADGFLYGISTEEKAKTEKFLDHISNGLSLDVQKALPELNENLKFSTFINDKYSIGICDLFCYCLLCPELAKFEFNEIIFTFLDLLINTKERYVEDISYINAIISHLQKESSK